jgi:hypothetical protein
MRWISGSLTGPQRPSLQSTWSVQLRRTNRYVAWLAALTGHLFFLLARTRSISGCEVEDDRLVLPGA